MNHKESPNQHIFYSLKYFINRMTNLIQSPVFIVLTFFGNSLIGIFSYVFYTLESGTNRKLESFIDALWWGFATATTTGYGDITPVTIQGKILGIVLMLTGLAFFGMFTALFAETILASARHNKL